MQTETTTPKRTGAVALPRAMRDELRRRLLTGPERALAEEIKVSRETLYRAALGRGLRSEPRAKLMEALARPSASDGGAEGRVRR